MARSPRTATSAKKGRRLGGARAYHHGDLRQALISAARELLQEAGVSGLTLRGVARRAGVSQTAPYRHFASHADLIAAVAEEGFRQLHARMLDGARLHAGKRGLQQLAIEYARFALERPAEYRIMFGPEVAALAESPAVAAARGASNDVMALLQGGIEQLQTAGMVRAGDSRTIALAAWSLVHGVVMLTLDGQRSGDKPTEELVRDVTSLLMVGMAATR